MFTRALVPLKTSALPYFPAVVQVAFAIVPVFPFPEESATVVPVPSLNEYAATNPEIGLPIRVASLAVLLAVLTSPPPDTVAVLVTLAGAAAATFTVRVITL